MGVLKRQHAHKRDDDDEPEPQPAAEVSERKAALDDDIDDLLDDIDGVLEANAQEFVQSYVQKGGQ